MKKKNIFSRLAISLAVFSVFAVVGNVSAETTVIIKNLNSTDHEVELTNTTGVEVSLTGWRLVQQNLPADDEGAPQTTDLSGVISASADRVISVPAFGASGAVFYLYDDGNNLVMSATIALDEDVPIISGVSPVDGSRVGGLTTLTFSSSQFNDPGCQVDGLNWGSPCNGSTFAAIPGWGNVAQGPFTLTIRDTNSAGVEGRLSLNYTKDITAPTLGVVNATAGNIIKLNFSENLQTDLLTADFMVSSEDGDNPVVSATVDGSIITLTLQYSFLNTDTIVLNINPFKPISIKDSVGNEFVPSDTVAVVNNIPEVVVVIPPAEEESSGGGGGGSSGMTTGYIPMVQSTSTGSVLGTTIFKFTRNLSQGQKHPDIIELQKRLMQEGLFASSTPTDYFGPKTLAAVKIYQKNNKLPTTGYIGPMTRAVLNGWFAKNRPENNIASIYEQILNLQNLLKLYLNR